MDGLNRGDNSKFRELDDVLRPYDLSVFDTKTVVFNRVFQKSFFIHVQGYTHSPGADGVGADLHSCF